MKMMKVSVGLATAVCAGALFASNLYTKDGITYELDPEPVAGELDVQATFFGHDGSKGVREVFSEEPIHDEFFRVTYLSQDTPNNPWVGLLRFYNADEEPVCKDMSMTDVPALLGTDSDGRAICRPASDLAPLQTMSCTFGDPADPNNFGYYKLSAGGDLLNWNKDYSAPNRFIGTWDGIAYPDQQLCVGQAASTPAVGKNGAPFRRCSLVFRLSHTDTANFAKGISSYIYRRRFNKNRPTDVGPQYEPRDWVFESSPDGKIWTVVDVRRNVPHVEESTPATLYNNGVRMQLKKLVRLEIDTSVTGDTTLGAVCPEEFLTGRDSGTVIVKKGAGTLVIDRDIANPIVVEAGQVKAASPTLRWNYYRVTVTKTGADQTWHTGPWQLMDAAGNPLFAPIENSPYFENAEGANDYDFSFRPADLTWGKVATDLGYSGVTTGGSLNYFFYWNGTTAKPDGTTRNKTMLVNRWHYVEDGVPKVASLRIGSAANLPAETRVARLVFRLPYGATIGKGFGKYNLMSFIDPSSGTLSAQAKSWMLEASTDGVAWTKIAEESDRNYPNARYEPYAEGPFSALNAITDESILTAHALTGGITVRPGASADLSDGIAEGHFEDASFSGAFKKQGAGTVICRGETSFAGDVDVVGGTLAFSSAVCTNEWWRYTGLANKNSQTGWVGNMQFYDAAGVSLFNGDLVERTAVTWTTDAGGQPTAADVVAPSDLAAGEIMGGLWGDAADPANLVYYKGNFSKMFRVTDDGTQDMLNINHLYGYVDGALVNSTADRKQPQIGKAGVLDCQKTVSCVFRQPASTQIATKGAKTYRVRSRYYKNGSTWQDWIVNTVLHKWMFESSPDGIHWITNSLVNTSVPVTTNTWFFETFKLVPDDVLLRGPDVRVNFGGSVRVRAGATLDLTCAEAPTVTTLKVDDTDTGMIKGALTLAESGSLELTVPAGKRPNGYVVPLTLDGLANPAALADWSATFNGKAIELRIRYDATRRHLFLEPKGLLLIYR